MNIDYNHINKGNNTNRITYIIFTCLSEMFSYIINRNYKTQNVQYYFHVSLFPRIIFRLLNYVRYDEV